MHFFTTILSCISLLVLTLTVPMPMGMSGNLFAQAPAGGCPNGITQAQLNQVKGLLSTESPQFIQAKLQEMCSDPKLTYAKLDALLSPINVPKELQPPSTLQLPDSIKRRLIINNQVSNITPDTWPATATALAKNGTLPPGVDPYFPEEKAALKQLGFSDADLNSIPPAGDMDEIFNRYADEKYQDAKSGGRNAALGLSMGFVLVWLYAWSSIGLFVQCKSLPSSQIFFWSSMFFLTYSIIQIVMYLNVASQVAGLLDNDPGKQMMSSIDEYKKAVDRGMDYVGQGKDLANQAQDTKDTCTAALPPGTSVDKINTCINAANKLGVDATQLKAKGIAWLECEANRVGQAALDQYDLLDGAHRLLKSVRDSVLANAISTSILSAAWGVAEGFAIAEAANPSTGFGACVADAGNNSSVKGYASLGETPEQFIDRILTPEAIQKMLNLLIPEAQAGKENAGKEFKSMGFDLLFAILLMGGVWLVMMSASIDAAFIPAGKFGVQRAIVLGAAAVTAIVGTGFLWATYKYLSDVYDEMGIFLKALKRTLTNEGLHIELGEWEKSEEHLGVDKMNDDQKKDYNPCDKVANNAGDGATSPGAIPTIPAGATIPPGIPTIPPGATLPPGTPTIPFVPKVNTDETFVSWVVDHLMLDRSFAQSRPTSLDDFCIVGPGLRGQQGCACRANQSCKKFPVTSIKMPKGIAPARLQNHIMAFKDVSKGFNQLSTSDLEGARRSASRLDRRLKAIKAEQRNLNIILNQALAKKKKRQVDISSESEKLRRSIEVKVKNAYATMPQKGKDRIGQILNMNLRPDPNIERVRFGNIAKVRKGVRSLKRFLASLGSMGKRRFKSRHDPFKKKEGNNSLLSYDYDMDEQAETAKKRQQEVHYDASLSGGEVEGSEIIKDEAIDIFRVITIRYMKLFYK